jgi:hypothetical protein
VSRLSWVLGALSAAFVGLSSQVAAAEEPATARVLQFGAGFRYGLDFEEGDFNPWAYGLGLDVGYTLPQAIYFGGSFEYFFGSKATGAGFEIDGNIWQLTAEGGYDLGLGDAIVLRPKLGAGVASLRQHTCVDTTALGAQCDDASESDLALLPGLSFLYLGPSFSFSLDGRYEFVFAKETLNGFIFSFGIGF